MGDPNAWHVVLRDIMIMLAAASVIVSSVFVALIAWRLYRLSREMQHDFEPIVASMQETADTMRDTSEFVGSGAVSPAVSVIGVASGIQHVVRAVQRFTRQSHSSNGGSGGA